MDRPLRIGALIYPRVDQSDFTGPFEVLVRVSNSTFHVLWKDKTPIRDVAGLILTPGMTLAEAPQLDVLVVPGGYGQQELMEDEAVLSFIRTQAVHADYIFSVCTGALLCGAAGLLRGVRATTHWTALHLLPYFGAIAVDERVVVDGKHVSAAGVTAGIDGALTLAALLRGEKAAQQIQLSIQYNPEPPFDAGSPHTAAPDIVEAVRLSASRITAAREATAKQMQDRGDL